MSTKSFAQLLTLETEIRLYILQYISLESLCSLSITCKLLSNECNETFRRVILILQQKYSWFRKVVSDSTIFKIANQNLMKFVQRLVDQQILIIGGNVHPHRTSLIKLVSSNKLESEWIDLADTKIGREVYFEALWFRGFVYVFCGIHHDSYGKIERYNPFTNKWHQCPSLPSLAGVMGCVFYGNVYMIGGYNWIQQEYSRSVYFADEDGLLSKEKNNSKCWKLLDSKLALGRSSHACMTFKGRIWVAGGIVEGLSAEGSRSVEVYDPALGYWCNGPKFNVRRFRLKLLVVNDELYAVGGDRDNKGKKLIQTIEKLVVRDVETMSSTRLCLNNMYWVNVTKFSEDRRGFACSAVGSKIYFLGGRRNDVQILNWDSYDTANDTWESQNDNIKKASARNKRGIPRPIIGGRSITIPPTNSVIHW